jgi:hypothetical protein
MLIHSAHPHCHSASRGKSKTIKDMNWTLSGYRHRIKSGSLLAEYIVRGGMSAGAAMRRMGLAAGGKMCVQA